MELSSLKKAHSPSLRVANYGVQINSNGKPSTSFLHTPEIFHVPWDLDLAKYRPLHGSLFGRAIQVTKVCKHLPTHKLHKSALEIGRRWSDISTIGEDHTLWATREYHWETWTSFEKFLQKSELGTWTGSREHSGEGCSIQQPPKTKGWKTNTPHLPEP